MGKKQRAASWLAATGLRRLLSAALPRHGVLVLNYHRIGDGSNSIHDQGVWSASGEAFDRQLAFLKTHADVIALDDIEQALASGRGRHVAITFDDGYLDNYELAFPLLQQHRLPAAFFITTSFIDDPRLPWWDEIAQLVHTTDADRLRLLRWFPQPLALGNGGREAAIRALLQVYKSLREVDAADLMHDLREQARGANTQPAAARHWMGWDMIRDMAAQGMTIGGHTMHHPVLARLPEYKQREQILGCAARLREELDQPMDYFAYPVGSRDAFDEGTLRCLREAGVRLAFSYYGGVATRRSSRYDMQRVAVAPEIGCDLFRAMVDLPGVFCTQANG